MIAGQEARARGMASMDAGTGSAVSAYLARLHATHGAIDDGEVATYIPELARVDPVALRHLPRDRRRRRLRGRRHARPVHDPVDVEAAHLRARARAPAAREAVRSRDRRRAERRRVQRDQPLARDRHAAQPDDQRGAIACAGLVASDADDPFALLLETYSRYAGRAARARRGRLPVGARRPGTATAPSRTSCASFGVHRRRRRPRSTSTSASARSRSTAATSR